MPFSDHLRFWDKDKKDDSKGTKESSVKKLPPIPPEPLEAPAPQPPPSVPEEPQPSFEQQKVEAQKKLCGLEKDLQDVRANLDKLDLEGKNRREEHQQTSQMLRMDAEREIKYLERKLQEDNTAWSKQLSEREKALEQAAHQSEATQQEKKAAFEQQSKERQEAVIHTEAALREQQAKLAQERQKWQELLRGKDAELVALRQELNRREGALEEELRSQEAQQKAAKELWETRLKELEKQWADKRKAWEEAMKATEDERLRLNNSFQERQAAWTLEQERRIQEIARREERAAEKLAALQAHFNKEAQTWKQMVKTREEQVKELRVKLLLSETDAKGRAEQAQKMFQEKVVSIAQQVQTLQGQLNEEQANWTKKLETKEYEIAALKDQVQTKLRQLESEHAQKMSALTAAKETLTAELQTLKTQQKEQQQESEERLAQLKAEQTTLEAAAQQRLSLIQKNTDQETLRLQGEIQKLEAQKDLTDKEVQALRTKGQDELREKEDLLKAVQAAMSEQESALRLRYAPDEESLTRQADALRTRFRSLEREITKARESIERVEKERADAVVALKAESEARERELEERSTEQLDKLKKRLDERKLSLEAFLVMKKDEETRLQVQIKTREKERAELSARLENLPKIVEQELKAKREATQKDIENFQKQIQKAEQDLVQAREKYKGSIQTKASQLGALRQTLDTQHKELSAALRTQEQVWASERAVIEKQLTTSQSEMDRIRTHWQAEISKKELEIKTLEEEILKQDATHRQALEREQKVLADQIAPVEKQRQDLAQQLEQERLAHEQAVRDLEKEQDDVRAALKQAAEQAVVDQKNLEIKFREEKIRMKAQLESLVSSQEAVVIEAKTALGDKAIQVEHLEEQIRQQAVAHETKKRDLIHSATMKSRTLQDILQQIETEMKAAREAYPREQKAKEEQIAVMTEQLAAEQARHQRMLSRYDRAMQTLTRRGHVREEASRVELARLKEEGAKKLAVRDSEIAALQSDLMAKEADRQGELERLAKQFAEERFQMEKSKEELEWKLKDHKEVSERQLNSRQKEIHFLESEITRVRTQREQQMAQKSATFEGEKQKIQTALLALQTQTEEERKGHEKASAAKEAELQSLISTSKKQLTTLGEEFNQKVTLWKSTNQALKGQIDQLKQHWAEAQDHWETIRKEKTEELTALRQEVGQWEARLQSDVQTLERTHEQDRQLILNQLRKKEKEFTEAQALFARRLKEKDEDLAQAMDEIRQRETSAETQWRSSLEQWQMDKQNLDVEKARMEQDLIQLQSRTQRELREMEDAIAKLRVDVTFKESQTHAQQEHLRAEHEKELQPLRDQVTQASSHLQHEKANWEVQLQSKDNDIKVLKTRLAWRDKRLKEEIARREKELSSLQHSAAAELKKVRDRYEAEKARLENQIKDRRSTLGGLDVQQNKHRQHHAGGEAQAKQSLQAHRKHLEESVSQLEAQHAEMRRHYEALLREKEETLEELESSLKLRDVQLQETRQKARAAGQRLRKELETIQHLQQSHSAFPKGGRLAPVWATFEQGIHQYKSENWTEAAHLFQECVQQDSGWSAAYQYLALSFHALGQESEAAWAAEQALAKDPDNARLAAWANQVRAAMNIKKQPPAA